MLSQLSFVASGPAEVYLLVMPDELTALTTCLARVNQAHVDYLRARLDLERTLRAVCSADTPQPANGLPRFQKAPDLRLGVARALVE